MPTHFDIFNGDADGICALQQLRLQTPRTATLITGTKREINLLKTVTVQERQSITVLDVSLDTNRADLLRLIEGGATVLYFDHHFAGDIPNHPNLTAHINTAANICTSLLVNQQLQGAQQLWAAVGAFGDNLFDAANSQLADLNNDEKQQLEILGTLLNYNGYGTTLDDLFFHPAELYRAIAPYPNPLDFIAEQPAFATLQQGYNDDMARIRAIPLDNQLLMLPDRDWSRRVAGVYGNLLARQNPSRAHALATALPDGSYRISVRAPLTNRQGADRLCMQFPTGGGRTAAAGINALPATMLEDFSQKFHSFWR
ncbi:MAG: acetyltransferase [Mariprofundales bacterium]